MKVLHCVTTLNPKAGGSVEAGRLLALGMRRRGLHVEIVTLDSPSNRLDENWPFTIHCLGPAHGSYLYSPRLIPWLIRRAGDFDATVVHDMYRYIGYAAWRANRITGSPYYLFTHGMLDPWYNKPSLKALKKQIFWKLAGRRMLRDAAVVLYTAEDERHLAHLSYSPFECRESVVGLGIEDPVRNARLEDSAFRRNIGLPDDQPYILFLGRITEKKRVDLLIRSFAAIYRDDANRLVIAGPDENGLRRRWSESPEAAVLGNRLIWTGHLDGPDKWAAIAGAEAMALISHTENFGISLAEALAMGVPVLTTNKVNIWREIVDGGAGFADEDSLQGANRVLSRWRSTSATQKMQMRSNAREVFLNYFAVDCVVRKLVDLMSAGVAARTSERSIAPRSTAPARIY
jgi:glycosyltransferase involved in cell wall biosynthesis